MHDNNILEIYFSRLFLENNNYNALGNMHF